MVLSGPRIKREVELTNQAITEGRHWGLGIVIDPYNDAHVGPNSVDIYLGDTLYQVTPVVQPDGTGIVLAWDPGTVKLDPVPLDKLGHWLLDPNKLYLGHSIEWTETRGLVPILDGTSTLARLGVSVHETAGQGEDGFAGQWTMEISVRYWTKLRPGMRIAQILYQTLDGPSQPYQGRYQGSRGAVGPRDPLKITP